MEIHIFTSLGSRFQGTMEWILIIPDSSWCNGLRIKFQAMPGGVITDGTFKQAAAPLVSQAPPYEIEALTAGLASQPSGRSVRPGVVIDMFMGTLIVMSTMSAGFRLGAIWARVSSMAKHGLSEVYSAGAPTGFHLPP
jgi:hypothetical protein